MSCHTIKPLGASAAPAKGSWKLNRERFKAADEARAHGMSLLFQSVVVANHILDRLEIQARLKKVPGFAVMTVVAFTRGKAGLEALSKAVRKVRAASPEERGAMLAALRYTHEAFRGARTFAATELPKAERLSPDLMAEIQRASATEAYNLDAIVADNLGVVRSVIERLGLWKCDASEGLEGEGNLALLRAVRSYDSGFDTALTSYAVPSIENAVLRLHFTLRNQVVLPVHGAKEARAVYQARAAIEQRTLQAASAADVAEELGIPVADVKKAEAYMKGCLSSAWVDHEQMEAFGVGESEGGNVELDLEREEVTAILRQGLESLTPRQAEVLRLRFGFGVDEPLSHADIARRLGVSYQRCQQLERAALDALRRGVAGRVLTEGYFA